MSLALAGCASPDAESGSGLLGATYVSSGPLVDTLPELGGFVLELVPCDHPCNVSLATPTQEFGALTLLVPELAWMIGSFEYGTHVATGTRIQPTEDEPGSQWTTSLFGQDFDFRIDTVARETTPLGAREIVRASGASPDLRIEFSRLSGTPLLLDLTMWQGTEVVWNLSATGPGGGTGALLPVSGAETLIDSQGGISESWAIRLDGEERLGLQLSVVLRSFCVPPVCTPNADRVTLTLRGPDGRTGFSRELTGPEFIAESVEATPGEWTLESSSTPNAFVNGRLVAIDFEAP